MGKNVRRTKRLIKRRINSAKKRLTNKRFTKSRIKVSNRKSKIKVSKKRLTKRRMNVSKRRNKKKMKGGSSFHESPGLSSVFPPVRSTLPPPPVEEDRVMEAVFKFNEGALALRNKLESKGINIEYEDLPVKAKRILYPKREGESVEEFIQKNNAILQEKGFYRLLETILEEEQEMWAPPVASKSPSEINQLKIMRRWDLVPALSITHDDVTKYMINNILMWPFIPENLITQKIVDMFRLEGRDDLVPPNWVDRQDPREAVRNRTGNAIRLLALQQTRGNPDRPAFPAVNKQSSNSSTQPTERSQSTPIRDKLPPSVQETRAEREAERAEREAERAEREAERAEREAERRRQEAKILAQQKLAEEEYLRRTDSLSEPPPMGDSSLSAPPGGDSILPAI